jgi:hypothetical protein
MHVCFIHPIIYKSPPYHPLQSVPLPLSLHLLTNICLIPVPPRHLRVTEFAFACKSRDKHTKASSSDATLFHIPCAVAPQTCLTDSSKGLLHFHITCRAGRRRSPQLFRRRRLRLGNGGNVWRSDRSAAPRHRRTGKNYPNGKLRHCISAADRE